MEEKKVKLISNKKLLLSASILVSSIIIIGLSLTYAYFETTYTGTENVTGNKAATLNVTSTLDTVGSINATELSLINASEVSNKAKSITFTVSNTGSTVNAKYTVKLINYSITKNLESKFFKWRLVVNHSSGTPNTFEGNFANGTTEPTSSTSKTEKRENLSKDLITQDKALTLAINASDSLTFYVWLENEANTDQLYLTSGSFSGKLSVEAVPTK